MGWRDLGVAMGWKLGGFGWVGCEGRSGVGIRKGVVSGGRR